MVLKRTLKILGVLALVALLIPIIAYTQQRSAAPPVGGYVEATEVTAGLRVDSNGNLYTTFTSALVSVFEDMLAVLEAIRDNTDPVAVYTYQMSNERYISVGTLDDENEVTALPAVLVSLSARNASTNYTAYLKCANATAANTTPGSTAVAYDAIIPGGGGIVDNEISTIFSAAITCWVVTGKADTDTTDVVANDVTYNIRYRN